MQGAASLTTFDLADCDREPIHTPGSIQPHGHLLALQGPGLVLMQASAEAGQVLGRALGSCWGQGLDQLWAAGNRPELLEKLRRNVPERDLVQLGTVRVGAHAPYQAIAHRSENLVVLDLEELPPAGEAATLDELYPRLQAALGRLHAAKT